MTFEDFITLLSSDHRIRDMDEHWRLQRKQVCFDSVHFDMVGLFENLDADLTAILKRLFGDGQQIFDVRRHFTGNVSNGRILLGTLTEVTRTAIDQIYREDVNMYEATHNPSVRAHTEWQLSPAM
jgi:hypothetical protein